MIDTLFHRLDMPIKHGRIRSQAHSMNHSRAFEPSRSGNLVTRDQWTRPLRKNLRAAAGTASETGVAQFLNDPFERLLCDLHKKVDFNHGERFQMNGGKTFAKSSKQVRVIAERQSRVESADDVKFRQRIGVFLFGEAEYVVEQH